MFQLLRDNIPIAQGTYAEMRTLFYELPIDNKVLGQLKGCTRSLTTYEVKEVS